MSEGHKNPLSWKLPLPIHYLKKNSIFLRTESHYSHTIMPPDSETVKTLRHISRFFSKESISQLQNHSVINLPDFISLIFFMCPEQQFSVMCDRLRLLDSTNFPGELDLFDEFRRFSNWKLKLKEGLERIHNKLALFTLNLRAEDLNADNRKYCLNASRVCLYRVFEDLTRLNCEKLVRQMINRGAPKPERDFKYLELYFMFWHASGFLNVDNQSGFEHLADSLRDIELKSLSNSLGYPKMRYDRCFFNDNFPMEIYPIRDVKNAGFCLIINQVKYGRQEADRDSSLLDVAKLKKLMTSLNYSVVALEDVTKCEFCETVQTTIRERFLKNHSIFVLVVMGHGQMDAVCCPMKADEGDGRTWISHVYFKDILDSVLACDVLNDLPKIILFNACRGSDFFTSKDYMPRVEGADEFVAPVPRSDVITCYSSLKDFSSLRSKDYGSLFINVLCDVLTKRPDVEVCELFTLVSARLMQPTTAISKGFEKYCFGGRNQLANPIEFTSSLRKKLYLTIPDKNC